MWVHVPAGTPDLPEETNMGRGSLGLLSGGWGWVMVQVEGANISLEECRVSQCQLG